MVVLLSDSVAYDLKPTLKYFEIITTQLKQALDKKKNPAFASLLALGVLPWSNVVVLLGHGVR